MKTVPPRARSILGDIRRRAFRECIPIHASIELTIRCNLRCAHCYNCDREGSAPSPAAELRFDETRGLLDELRAEGTLFISLTGGEPMLHPRFWDILDEAAARRFAVTILTNGTLLGKYACRRLARHRNIRRVNLSFYGATGETHDALTRTPGSFRLAMEGLRNLRRLGLPAALNFLVTRHNAREIPSMIEWARSLSLPFVVDTSITPRRDGNPGPLEHRADLSDLESLYRGALRPLLLAGDPGHPGNDFRCDCARSNVAISAGGDVWPCIAAPISGGNIRRGGFRRIWNVSETFNRIRRLEISDFKTCYSCRLSAWCPRNNGTALLVSGDYTCADPRACSEAEIIRRILRGKIATRSGSRAGRATSQAAPPPENPCPRGAGRSARPSCGRRPATAP